MANNNNSRIQEIPLEHLQRKATMVTNYPDIVGYALPGTKESEVGWQLRKETWNTTSGVLQNTDFARLVAANGDTATNDFVFSWAAQKQVTELHLSTELLAGNTASITIDATPVTKLFATSHDATLAAWATDIAAEAGVGTADVRGPNVIVITAAVAGTPVAITAPSVTGGAVQAVVTIVPKVLNQVAAASLTFGSGA